MKRTLPDLGTYSDEDTKAIAVLALAQLTLDMRVKAVLEAFDGEERGELACWLDKGEDD